MEIRRVTLTNLSDETREIELTTYAEVVMAPQNADLAHSTFSNLFVQTEITAQSKGPSSAGGAPGPPDEKTPWMFHMLAVPGTLEPDASYETDRSRFIGRGRTPANPAALAGTD